MFGILKSILFLILFFYVLSAIILYIFQRTFIYFPSAFVAHDFKNEVFINEGESINVIVLNENKKKALVYFGGNGEAVVYSALSLQVLFLDHSVYLVNYRGYGGSTGTPKEKALFSDALYIYDELIKKHSSISIMGRSLGSGIASYLASKRSIDKLILITPYDSIQTLAQKRFPIYPMALLLKDKYDSIKRINKIKAKVLIIMAQNDNVIPFKHSQNLIKNFPKEQITVKIILNKEHNDLSNDKEYNAVIKAFIQNDK